MKSSNVIDALAALAQTSRLAIFRALVQAGPTGLSAGKIAKVAELAPTSVSFHMKEMVHARIVTSRSEGRFVIYAANFSTMNALIVFLTENCCGGNPCSPKRSPICATPEERLL
jgi:ArsR family transcriptional regulator, arsenate/arsenite/antimonite-responsive transcriptional repressor